MPHAIQRGDATVAQAADYLNVTERTVYRKVHDGELPARRLGRHLRISWADVEALVQDVNPTPADPIKEAALRVVSEAPKLSAAQLDQICNLLRGVA